MDNRVSVLLISIDALKPEFVLQQQKNNVKLPNLTKYFLENGCIAVDGMKSVFPTFTYPCHQSMITGTTPAVHGTFNNGIFDPTGEYLGAWYWSVSDKVKNLWEVAKENGYISASVAFPTSLKANGDYIAPEFWWNGSAFDSLMIDALAKPQGLIKEMEKNIGRYPNGLDLSPQGDRKRFEASMWMLEHKIAKHLDEKPFFMSAYFASFDEMAHEFGVYSKEAADALEKIDEMVGSMIKKVHEMTDNHVVVCVVSDHGTIDNHHNIFPNVLLANAGLLEVDESGKVREWKAWAQRAGGMAEIRLKDNADEASRTLLKELMNQLANDTNSGIYEILNREEAIKRGGFPLAEYVLVAQKGVEIREEAVGEYLRDDIYQKAQHGYSEDFEEMRASFMIEGEGIEKGVVNDMRLIDVAVTLADIMGFELPDAQGEVKIKKS